MNRWWIKGVQDMTHVEHNGSKLVAMGGIRWWRPVDLCWPSMTWTIPRQLHISQTPYSDMSAERYNWLYQKQPWDQAWPAKSPLECLFSWEYHSWLWQAVSVLCFWRYDDWNSGYGKWFIIMVVYLFNHRLLSQLGERLQVTDRFAVLT